MPTTIDREPHSQVPIVGIVATLLIWFAGMTIAALILKPTAVVAFGQPSQLFQAAANTKSDFLNAGHSFVIVRPRQADSVRQLYAHGAWLVWPMVSSGCKGRN